MNITQAFFDRLAARGYEPLLHTTSGTIRLDIQDEGSWLVVMKNGSLTVSRDMASADCVAICRKEDFEHVAVGEQNPNTLYLQDKLSIMGNIALSLMFQRVFPDETLAAEQAEQRMKEVRLPFWRHACCPIPERMPWGTGTNGSDTEKGNT
jgi:predicted lipid carrier protein YhbT